MIDLGKVKPGSTIRIPWGSYTGSTGASSAASNYAAGDILIYKDGGTTARASTNGFTATTSFSSVTGINVTIIDLADNTTAGFFAAGSEYFVVVSPVTVDSQTVAFPIARFIIGLDGTILDTTIATLASQTSFTLTLGPAEDDALNGCTCYIHDVASAVQGGMAFVLDYTGSTKTVTLSAGATFTAAASDNIMFFPRTDVHTVGGIVQTPRDIGASVLLSNGTGTGQIKLASGYVAMTWADIAAPTTTVGLSGTTVKTATDVETDTADIQGRLPAALSAGGNIKGDVLSLGGVVQSLTDLKDFADTGYDPSTHKVAGVVLTDTVTTYTGNTVQTGDAYGRLGAPTGASVSADVAAMKVDTAAILVDTGTTLDGKIDTIDTVVDAILVDTGTTLDSALAVVDANVDAILVDTGTTLDGKIDVIDGIVDSILVDTGTTLDAAIADLPTNAELATALGTADDAVLTAIADVPTNAELATALGTADDAVLAAIAALNNLSAATAAAAVRAIIVDAAGTITLQQAMSIMLANLAGVTTDAGATFKTPDGTATRAAVTVNASNERTAVTLTPSA